VEVLDAFLKLPEETISFVMLVCPSVRPHGTTRLPLVGFREISNLNIFRKSCEKIEV